MVEPDAELVLVAGDPVAGTGSGSAGRQRFTLLVLADGYPAARLDEFADRVDLFCHSLFRAEPFDRLRRLVSVYRLDRPDPPGSAGLHGRFSERAGGRTGRLLTLDVAAARQRADAALPGADMVLVQCDRAEYGGSGGEIAVFSAHPRAVEIALHEMGHTAFGLGDEYDYPAADDQPDEVGADPFPVEPPFPNLTVDPHPARLKWRALVAPGTALPTTDPTVAVGTFEGGNYRRHGVYRPSADCRMRTIGQPFCAVCQQQIRAVLLRRCITR